jgi:hypothetical protein
VRRAAERADELQAQMIAEVEAQAQAQMTPEAELDQVIAQTQPQGLTQAQQPQPEPRPGTQHQQDEWQHRYRTLQGKYDAEIPHLRAQIQQLEQLIATMQSAPAQSQAQPTQLVAEIPEEDYTTYGPEFVDSTRRWARAELSPEVTDLRRQIAELQAHAQQSTGDRVKDRVRQDLDRDPELAGRWQAMDGDPGFNQWLQEFDPFSGNRRLDMLRAAYASGDSVRTGRFFKAYIHEHTDPTYNPPIQQPQTPQPYVGPSNGQYAGNGAAQMDLSAYAAPGRASNATPGPGAPDQRIWTTREIQAFYDGRLKGRFRGRDQEADRLERDILAAAAEGRIRNA